VVSGRVDARLRALGLATFGGTEKVGFYSIEPAIPGQDARAVNLLDESESLIAVNTEFRVAAGELESTQDTASKRQPLWPYLLAALGVVLFIEWFVYNKRVLV